jgi:hypothetical protein
LWRCASLYCARGAARADELKDPVNLRGFNLGMTLSEFRATSDPDKTIRSAQIICVGDKHDVALSSLPFQIGADLKKVGVEMCSFFSKGKYSAWDLSGLQVGEFKGMQTFFYFTPKVDNPVISERLFSILIRGNETHYDSIVSTYAAKYGKPHDSKHETWQNQLGAVFDNLVLTWNSNRSSIVITQRTSNAKVFTVDYSEIALSADISRLIDAKAKAAADKL